MTTYTAGQSGSEHLAAGKRLTLTLASADVQLHRFSAGAFVAGYAISASATYGPYFEDMVFRVSCNSGTAVAEIVAVTHEVQDSTEGADIANATLTGAVTLTGATLTDGTFTDPILDGAIDASTATLTGATLASPTVTGTAILTGATVTAGTFSGPAISAATALSLTNNVTVTTSAGVPADAVRATLARNPAGAENALTYQAVAYGTGGNAITVAYVNPNAISAALSVVVAGNAITVNLATGTGTASSLLVNPAGAENAITYTAATAGVTGDDITIAYVDPSANDAALSVVVVGTAITVNLATGPGGAITSTAALVKAAVEAATALVTLAYAADGGANDGSGVVTAMAAANLAGGAWGAITSTAAQIKTAIEASGPATALVTAAFATDGGLDDGSGVVTALAAANMTGGTGTGIGTAGPGALHIDYTNADLYVNGGTLAVPVWKLVTRAA